MNLQLKIKVTILFLVFVISKTTANPSFDKVKCLSSLTKECHPHGEGNDIEDDGCGYYKYDLSCQWTNGWEVINVGLPQYFDAVDDYNNCIVKTNNTCNCTIEYQTEIQNNIGTIVTFYQNSTTISIECSPQYIKAYCSTPFFTPEMYTNAMIYIHALNNSSDNFDGNLILEKAQLPMLCSEEDCSNGFISFWINRYTYYFNETKKSHYYPIYTYKIAPPTFDEFFRAIKYSRAIANKRFCINKGQTISVFGTTPHYEPSNFTGYGGCPNNLEYCPGGSCAIPYNIANQTIFKAYKEANEKIHYCLYGKSKSSSGALLGLSIFGGVAGALLVTCVLYHCCKKERNSELRQNLLSSDKQGRFPLIVNNDSIAYMP